jgi:hypothetical protein
MFMSVYNLMTKEDYPMTNHFHYQEDWLSKSGNTERIQ